MQICHNLFIHFRVCAFKSLPVRVIMNSASMHIFVYVFCGLIYAFMSPVSFGEELRSTRQHVCGLSRYYPTVFQSGCAITLLTADTGIFSLFHSSHSGRCVCGVTWAFNLHIPDNSWSWVPFPILTDHLDNFFCEAEFFTFEATKLQVLLWILPGCRI